MSLQSFLLSRCLTKLACAQAYARKRIARTSTIHGLAGMAAIAASTYKAYLGEGLGPLSFLKELRIPHPGRVRSSSLRQDARTTYQTRCSGTRCCPPERTSAQHLYLFAGLEVLRALWAGVPGASLHEPLCGISLCTLLDIKGLPALSALYNGHIANL